MTLQKHPAISVAATADTFRRVGHVFGRTPQTLVLAALSPEAYRAITDDPSLVVVPTAIELSAERAKALPYHDATHVRDALASVGTLTLDLDDEDKHRTLALEARQAELDAQSKSLDERQAELDSREQALDAREKALTQTQATDTAKKADAAGKTDKPEKAGK
ncbi:hypothetical protein [Pandoraea sp. SD6-2]|uniref:hypothetical protein n=1 Tax=Pandoraea sp. SD6-2 TaxID=1286093 RepID=UPI00032F7150|nr:hypothetical protein [Pandoraea sp. SD6-2]EON13083.1 hypothetical protein C266_13764 [Pandoraea sp. SD6-2]